MPPYASVADMVDRYGETFLEKFNLTIVSGVCAELLELLEDSTDEIESYVRAAGYAVPLSTVPGVILRCCCQMTFYEIFDRVDASPTKKAIRDNEYWIGNENKKGWLEKLADRKVMLDVSTEPTADTSAQDIATSHLTQADMDMTDDILSGFAFGGINGADD